MQYDEQYRKVAALFGTEAEATLKRFANRLKPGSQVLDIGAGQGRNAFFLAERNVTVHALEPSSVAARTLGHTADKKGLRLKVFSTTFQRFVPPVSDYAGILVFGLMPDIEWAAIRILLERIDNWSRHGTIVWTTGFTTQDPAYTHHKTSWMEIGTNSFRSSEGQVRTYLEHGQILELFKHYSVLHHWEGLGPEHRHGDEPPERHGKFEAVFVRTDT